MNSSRVYEDLRERVVESRRRLEADLRSRLTHLSQSAAKGLARAAETQRLGTAAVQAEASRLTALGVVIDAELAAVNIESRSAQ